MFKLGYHTRGAILSGPHLLMTRLAAKQSHYCGLFLPQPTPRLRHRGRQPSRERERDGWRRWREGGIVKKKKKRKKKNPEKEGKTNGVHRLYRSHPKHLFIDHHINLDFIFLSACHDVSHVNFYIFCCLRCQHTVRR